jgi:hypothetical protein
MSSTILEQIRLNHEYAELFELGICDELDNKPSGVSTNSFHSVYPWLGPPPVVSNVFIGVVAAKGKGPSTAQGR